MNLVIANVQVSVRRAPQRTASGDDRPTRLEREANRNEQLARMDRKREQVRRDYMLQGGR